MAIIIPDGFEIQAGVPVDKRFRFTTLALRDALDPVVRFKGLTSYVDEDDTLYYLKAGITNGDWVPVGSGSGGGGGLNNIASISSKNFDSKGWELPVGSSVDVAKDNSLIFEECIKITLPNTSNTEIISNKFKIGKLFKDRQSLRLRGAFKTFTTTSFQLSLNFYDNLDILLTQTFFSADLSSAAGTYHSFVKDVKPFSPSIEFDSVAIGIITEGSTTILFDNLELDLVLPDVRRIVTISSSGNYAVQPTDDLIVVKPSFSESGIFNIEPPLETRANFTVKYVPKTNTTSGVTFTHCEDDVEMYSNSSRTFYFDTQDSIWRAL